tara:strand:- start:1306 stop:1536 length:231 start_codon:yes stop_codon:yes gene_type:complete
MKNEYTTGTIFTDGSGDARYLFYVSESEMGDDNCVCMIIDPKTETVAFVVGLLDIAKSELRHIDRPTWADSLNVSW